MSEIVKRLPKAKLIRFAWGKHFYFAKFRLANAVRLQLGWLVVEFRAPWLEHSARRLHPELFKDQSNG